MAKQNRDQPTPDSTQKDPDEWVTGDESMTSAQASYLKTLGQEAGEEIDELQERTGRGRDH